MIAAGNGPVGAGNTSSLLTKAAGSLRCAAVNLALRTTMEPRQFFESLLSSQKVTYSVPQCQPEGKRFGRNMYRPEKAKGLAGCPLLSLV